MNQFPELVGSSRSEFMNTLSPRSKRFITFSWKEKRKFPAQMEIEEDFCERLSFAMICILSWESWKQPQTHKKCTEPNEDGEVLTDMKTKIVSGGKVNRGMTRTTPLFAHLQIMLQILGRNVRAQATQWGSISSCHRLVPNRGEIYQSAWGNWRAVACLRSRARMNLQWAEPRRPST